MAAGQRDLNARERKRVYMHSTIFDDGGPTSKSIYAQNQQNDLYEQLNPNLKARTPPSMDLPRPADIQCTQNAGHAVVLPSDIGVDSRGGYGGTGREVAKGPTPRSSGPQYLVTDGDPMPVTRAGGKDVTIPQEFWQTSVNLQWHDPRNELSRQNKAARDNFGAQDLKLKEMSSEIFGKERLAYPSTQRPGADLLSAEVDQLQVDSSLNPNLRDERASQLRQQETAHSRFAQNLANSEQSSLQRSEGYVEAPLPPQDDPQSMQRRRQEKNFSDLFGTQMGERRDFRGKREEMTATRTASFLDTRTEIASRNKGHWRPGQAELEGADFKEAPNVSNLRKEAELDSNLFDRTSPQRMTVDGAVGQVTGTERVCWDTRDIMQTQAEVARRTRLKDFSEDKSAQERKWGGLASQQVRKGLGGEYDMEQPQFSPRGSSPRANRLTDPPRQPGIRVTTPAAPSPDRPKTAKDTKLASLQSSIFN